MVYKSKKGKEKQTIRCITKVTVHLIHAKPHDKKKKEEDLRFEELQTSVLKRAFKELQITSDPKSLFSYLHLCFIISTPIAMCDC